ncbi:MAG TPA: hypothetical protein VLH75_11360 [Longimicrobiales bacterium]|nr:hypothetical protein [Longimicrobiales bacterium]
MTAHLAVFVSPHGFGHAARASAVMEVLHRRTGAHFELFTTTPRWFYDESVQGLYRRHEVVSDVGFFQTSALAYDLERTVRAVSALVPFHPDLIDGLALEVRRAGCSAVLCDVAPLGIAVAERAGLPSVLVENFSWPWLYEPLLEQAPALAPLSEELDHWIGLATLHLQAEPYCFEDSRAHASVLPVSRPPRRSREELRRELGVGEGEQVVVLTMGGYTEEMPFLSRLEEMEGVTFVVTGCPANEVRGNLRLHDNATRLYMPHLVRAADAVVAKLGYSTVAEVWREGRPAAFVTRADFREMAPLWAWASERIPGFEIPAAGFASGSWVERIPELLLTPPPPAQPCGGAEQVVDHMLERIPALRHWS